MLFDKGAMCEALRTFMLYVTGKILLKEFKKGKKND